MKFSLQSLQLLTERRRESLLHMADHRVFGGVRLYELYQLIYAVHECEWSGVAACMYVLILRVVLAGDSRCAELREEHVLHVRP